MNGSPLRWEDSDGDAHYFEPHEVPDPAEVRKLVAQYMVVDKRVDAPEEGTAFDVAWPFLFGTRTGREVQAIRVKQRTQMARYGHQDYDALDRVQLTEFLERYSALYELLEKEGLLGNATET